MNFWYNNVMRKLLPALLLCAVLFSLSAKTAFGALLTFSPKGLVYWNVLGLESSSLEVKKIANDLAANQNTSVALLNNGGKVFLSYDGQKQVDLTGYRENIVEVEEQNPAKTLHIKATDSGFAITQKNVTVDTTFPIKINSRDNRLSVETASGERFLTVLPYEAVNQIVRTNLITKLISGSLIEKEEGEVVYEVAGEKEIVLLKIFIVAVPVKVEVSALTGSVITIDQPLWYSVVDFLLV